MTNDSDRNLSQGNDKLSDTEPAIMVENGKGNALYNLGKYEEAIQYYDKALEVNPEYTHTWNNKGNQLVNLGRNEEAIEYYDKAIEIDPKCTYAWNGKGNALYNLEKYDDAIKSYDKAIEIDAGYVDI